MSKLHSHVLLVHIPISLASFLWSCHLYCALFLSVSIDIDVDIDISSHSSCFLSLCCFSSICMCLAFSFSLWNVCVCIHLYIYAVKLLSGPSLGFLEVIIWSKFAFFSKTLIAKQHYKNSGFSTFFGRNNCAAKKVGSYYLVQVGVF